MTTLFKCDVQVVKYRTEALSQAANHFNSSFWNIGHPIPPADSHFLSPPYCSFLPFPPPCPPSNFQICHPALPSSPSSYLSMPRNPPGPWVLEEVKTRLRAEQVQRENAASARYRPDVKKSSCQCSVVLVLSLCCLLLSLVALLLSTVVLRLASKKEE